MNHVTKTAYGGSLFKPPRIAHKKTKRVKMTGDSNCMNTNSTKKILHSVI